MQNIQSNEGGVDMALNQLKEKRVNLTQLLKSLNQEFYKHTTYAYNQPDYSTIKCVHEKGLAEQAENEIQTIDNKYLT